MINSVLPYLTLITGGWMIIGGVLHDVAVVSSARNKPYDRDLLRLLMDGHVLITCGAMQIISFFGLRLNESWAYSTTIVSSLSLIIYCFMILPFLKSYLTLTLNILILILCVINFLF